MILLSWKCRELRNSRSVHDLYQMVKDKCPKVLFFMETLTKCSKLDVLRGRLGYEGCFGVDPIGRSRGLTMFWKAGVTFELHNYSLSHISR